MKNVRRETQTHTGKWGQALIFFGEFSKSGLDKAKEKEKNCCSISSFVNVTIPDIHGRYKMIQCVSGI